MKYQSSRDNEVRRPPKGQTRDPYTLREQLAMLFNNNR